MTHIGEKLSLGARGAYGGVSSLLHLRFHSSSLGYVIEGREHAGLALNVDNLSREEAPLFVSGLASKADLDLANFLRLANHLSCR